MAVIQDPTTALTAKVDGPDQALRVTERPQSVGSRGAYVASFYTGVIAAGLAANQELFQWRWVSAAGLICLIRDIRISAAVSTTAFAAGVPATLELRLARSWSVQGTGGTGITFGTHDGKKRTDHASTAIAANDVRIATTAGLGAGTKTLDGLAAATVASQPGTAIATFINDMSIWARKQDNNYPILLETQEGFVIRDVEVPGTGTWKLAVTVEWEELDPIALQW